MFFCIEFAYPKVCHLGDSFLVFLCYFLLLCYHSAQPLSIMHIFLWEDDIKYNEKFVVVLAYYSRYVVPNVHWGAIGVVWYILPILFFVIVIIHPVKLYLSTEKISLDRPF